MIVLHRCVPHRRRTRRHSGRRMPNLQPAPPQTGDARRAEAFDFALALELESVHRARTFVYPTRVIVNELKRLELIAA